MKGRSHDDVLGLTGDGRTNGPLGSSIVGLRTSAVASLTPAPNDNPRLPPHLKALYYWHSGSGKISLKKKLLLLESIARELDQRNALPFFGNF